MNLSEQQVSEVKAILEDAWHERCPGWTDTKVAEAVALATGADQYLLQDIDVRKFTLGLLFVEATFGAATNNDLNIDVRVRVPFFGNVADEFYTRLVLANNTSSPYARKGWLLIDLRVIDMASIYAESLGTAGTVTINKCGLRLVI